VQPLEEINTILKIKKHWNKSATLRVCTNNGHCLENVMHASSTAAIDSSAHKPKAHIAWSQAVHMKPKHLEPIKVYLRIH